MLVTICYRVCEGPVISKGHVSSNVSEVSRRFPGVKSRESEGWQPGERRMVPGKTSTGARGREAWLSLRIGFLAAGGVNYRLEPPVSEGCVRSDDATLLSRGWVLINHILMSKFGGFMFLRFAPVKKL